MRKNTLTAILGALVLIGTMPARAEIASKEYVDNQQQENRDVIYADGSYNDMMYDQAVIEIENNTRGGLAHNVLAKQQPTTSALYGTDYTGQIGGFYTKIGMNFLSLPEPGSECDNGCMLLVWKNGTRKNYAWEPVMRDNNESSYRQLNSRDGDSYEAAAAVNVLREEIAVPME